MDRPPHDARLREEERASLGRLAEADARDDRLRSGLGIAPRRGPGAAATIAYVDRLLAAPAGDDRLTALAAAAAAGDAAARDALVEAALPRVVAAARRHARQGTEFADLVQEGVLATLVALRRYDAATGTPFWAYALPWVRGAMARLVGDQRRATRLPPRALRDLAALKEAAASWPRERGRPGVAELAERAGVDPERARALVRADAPARSLEETLGDGDGALADVIPDPSAADGYDEVVRRAGIPELGALLGALSDREREVVERRFGLGGRPEETLRAVGERLGVTRERVRQIEARALAKLASSVSSRG